MATTVKLASGLAAAAVLLGLVATSAFAFHPWENYHWARTGNPFTLKLGKNVSAAWNTSVVNGVPVGYVEQAADDWTDSTVLDTVMGLPNARDARKCSPTSGKVQVCSYKYGFRGWLGIAQIWLSGNHITQGVTKVNDTYFNLSYYNTPAWRATVTCQEIGHNLGLDHQDENQTNMNLGTCMDYTDNPLGPPSNEHPNQHDYDELGIIYSHLDSNTTVSTAAVAAANPGGNSAADWGKAVRFTRSGKGHVFVKDLGAGRKMVTFVTWAE